MKIILIAIAILVLAIVIKRTTSKEEVHSEPLCFDLTLPQQSISFEEASNASIVFTIPSGKRHIFINQYFTNSH